VGRPDRSAGFPRSSPPIIPLYLEHGDEAGLFQVPIGGECVGEAAVAHDDARDAIGRRPLLVDALAVQLDALAEQRFPCAAVRWEVAEDDSFQRIARSGVAFATPQLAHSVHVEVDGLAADRWYFYRFHAADATSPVGRSRTMPTADKLAERLKFSFVSCQHYEQGLYTGYQHMAGEELDLVIHLGDYIYEGPTNRRALRQHVGGKLLTLADYRNRHAQYKSDPLLSGMHGQCPWLVTWDDHEFENNWAAEFVGSSISSSGNGPQEVSGLDALLAENPCVKFHDRQRAYVTCTVTPERWQSDYRVIDEVLKPGGKVSTAASFVVEAGKPTIERA